MNIAEIKERFSKITAGPWEYEQPTSFSDDHNITTVGENGVWIAATTYDTLSDSMNHNYVEDAEFIAHAPADIEYLLSIIKQAEKALQYYDTLYANIESNIQHGELITQWLRRQGETARTALKSIQGDE